MEETNSYKYHEQYRDEESPSYCGFHTTCGSDSNIAQYNWDENMIRSQ